ncbi:MAG: hypothetical protein FWG50_03810 [Kiritimatiellaeota bacterium]|nr:hypothetical protein [Kiritimatiellota bacterium]
MSDQEQGNIPPKATPAAPGAPRPITVRLKPVTPAPTDPAAAPQAAPVTADPGATVKLSPVVLTPVAAPAPVTPPAPVAPPASPSATSAIPAPTSAQVQASKSKTSRISLDSAIGVSTSVPIKPAEAAAPKTIRLKRPSDLSAPLSPVAPPTPKSGTAPIRQTSRIPDSVLPADAGLDSTVTQKKTLKIKRPGADAPAAEEDTSMDGVQMMPIPMGPVVEQGKGFTVTAIVFGAIAAVLLVALTMCLASDALGPACSNTGRMTADIFWPGKFTQ